MKARNLATIHLNITKLGKVTNFNQYDQICNSTQSPVQPQSGQYIDKANEMNVSVVV